MMEDDNCSDANSMEEVAAASADASADGEHQEGFSASNGCIDVHVCGARSPSPKDMPFVLLSQEEAEEVAIVELGRNVGDDEHLPKVEDCKNEENGLPPLEQNNQCQEDKPNDEEAARHNEGCHDDKPTKTKPGHDHLVDGALRTPEDRELPYPSASDIASSSQPEDVSRSSSQDILAEVGSKIQEVLSLPVATESFRSDSGSNEKSEDLDKLIPANDNERGVDTEESPSNSGSDELVRSQSDQEDSQRPNQDKAIPFYESKQNIEIHSKETAKDPLQQMQQMFRETVRNVDKSDNASLSPLVNVISNFKTGIKLMQQPQAEKSNEAQRPNTQPEVWMEPDVKEHCRENSSAGVEEDTSSPRTPDTATLRLIEHPPPSQQPSVEFERNHDLDFEDVSERLMSDHVRKGRNEELSVDSAGEKKNKVEGRENMEEKKEESGSPAANFSVQSMMDSLFSPKPATPETQEESKPQNDTSPNEAVANLEIPKLEQEETDNEKQSGAGFGGLLHSLSVVSAGRSFSQEQAHVFEIHTYKQPTNCDVCSGLLVGLWSQGLQCRLCGVNVHRGEGVGGHDDCRAEALLTGCPGEGHRGHCTHARKSSDPVQVGDVIQQLRQMAKEQPNFIRDAKAQWDRDINSKVKDIIVSKGTEEEKGKKLLRARNAIVPFVEHVDRIEHRGLVYVCCLLLLLHLSMAAFVGLIGWVGFLASIWPKHGFLTDSARELAALHTTTVIYSFHATVVMLVLLLRKLASLLNRKSNLLDQFLRDKLKLEAESDLGVSVNGVARRARLWANRLTISSILMCLIVFCLWHEFQSEPPLPLSLVASSNNVPLSTE